MRPTHILRISTLAALLLLSASVGSAELRIPLDDETRGRLVQETRLDPMLRAMVDRADLLATMQPTPLFQVVPEGEILPEQQDVPVLIRGEVDLAALQAEGFFVQTSAGGVTTAHVPLAALGRLLEVAGVQGVEAATALQPSLDVSALEIDANELWDGNPPSYPGASGKNVVVGIIDTGLDLNHADFRTTTNKTRVKYCWDQTQAGTGPPGFGYGVESTEAQINAGSVTQNDLDGHGSHIAGIAAGNGRATGNGYPSYRYVGIAPEADLVIVKSLLLENQVIDGVNYVFQKAGALGKDAVVLIASGSQRGGHDGSSSLDMGISALTGPGKIVVASVGNRGEDETHAQKTLSSGQTVDFNWSLPTYSPGPAGWEYVEVEGWHETSASFDVKVTSPGGYATSWITPNTSSGIVSTADGTLLVDNAIETNAKGAKRIRVYVWDRGDGFKPKVGTWKVSVKRRSGTSSGLLDAWVSVWRLGSGGVSPAFTTFIDYTRLVDSPATGDNVIGVGAYTTKTTWINVSGTPSFYVGNPPMWDIAAWSSPGPRRNGTTCPDVLAPGYGVVAALASYVSGTTSNVWKVEDGVHRIRYGTSAAAAHGAGGVALLLQETPDLTPASVRSTLQQQARSDTYTGAVPNGPWGYGKMDLVAGTVAVGDGVTLRFQFAPVFPNPARDDAGFQFVLTPEDLTGAGAVRVRVLDVRGRLVAVLPGDAIPGPQGIRWDGRSLSGAPAAPGVYIGRLEVGDQHAERKFVRVP